MFFKHKQATQTQTKHRTQRVYISYSLLVLLTRVWRALTLILVLVYFFAGHIAVAVRHTTSAASWQLAKPP